MTTSRPIDRVTRALKTVSSRISPRKNGCQAQCPAHQDRHESLSVSEDQGGKVLINCHAGCHIEDILKELGLNYEALFPDDQYGLKTKRTIRETYDYLDQNRKLLFQAIRYDPKGFRQRRPDGKGDWIYNLQGVHRIPYNLPGIIDSVSEGKPVFICEGEKDANNLIKRNLCATTSPMGAGKWSDSFNAYFEGADVIILPDNDDPGRNHARIVAQSLLTKANIHSLRIVELPGLKAKQDVTDWLLGGGTKDELLELTFNTDTVQNTSEVEEVLGISEPVHEDDAVIQKDVFRENKHRLFSTIDGKIIADFAIDIRSVVYDDRNGRIFYIKIREIDRETLHTTETIEIRPETLDDTRSFYKAIRPYSTGEIYQYRSVKTKPLSIFKWLLDNFDKPVVRRPDHVGFTLGANKRPFWIFGNAVVCPPWHDKKGKIVMMNSDGEFIIDEITGFTTPIYKNEDEKEKLTPIINTDIDKAAALLGEIKEKFIRLVGSGDETGYARNYGKLLLAYVIYHLYERELYHANDINGHTVMFYVHGPKGTGKTTYFNTILRAFFGLHNTEETKGNTVSTPALENKMGMYSSLPVCYDEYNPELAKIDYQAINGYYHKTARQVSDMDRQGRNKYTPIRSTLCFTSNYPINLDIDQADATESRMIYFQYQKAYRSNDDELFQWFKDNLDQLSKITVHLLLSQTDEKRKSVTQSAENAYLSMKAALDRKVSVNPNQYNVEHRLTDNYTRLQACYELVFGVDPDFRNFIYREVLERFATNRVNQRDNALLNQIIYLANSGRIKESWHYHYNDRLKELYVSLGQCYQTYEDYKRDKALSMSQFRDILKSYFEQCGGYQTGTKRWFGKYFDYNHEKVTVNRTQHSYVLKYYQVGDPSNLLNELFPVPEDVESFIKTAWEQHEHEIRSESEVQNFEEEVPF